ncbi:hypothetical protein L596_030015 [Steinernema carpocapsae]|uniref:Uncharacterized protein n=1 Tax=Steinernema carpocapsae TaxID=34508 RepID=A0A4U5LRG4_STECR|nr:hypothetical protein L596_030015 [Steinernema carpocapsae]
MGEGLAFFEDNQSLAITYAVGTTFLVALVVFIVMLTHYRKMKLNCDWTPKRGALLGCSKQKKPKGATYKFETSIKPICKVGAANCRSVGAPTKP